MQAITTSSPEARTMDGTNPPRVSIPDSAVHALRADAIEDDFEVWVARPQQGFAPAAPGPPRLLVVLDANLFFGIAVDCTRLMHKLYGELPPILVAGIAYPTEDGFAQGLLRSRDFTPSVDTGFAEAAKEFTPPGRPVPPPPPMGGADAFLDFLADAVLPFVSARYGVHAYRGTLFGSSLGGLLVTHALLTRPELFSSYIAVSPALWWHDDRTFALEAGRDEEARRATPPSYFAAGGREEAPEVPMLARFKLITNTRRMAERLGAPVEILEGETHTSVVSVGLTRGLRKLIGRGGGTA